MQQKIQQNKPLKLYSQLSITTTYQNGKQINKYTIGKYQYNSNDYLGQGFSSNVYKAVLLNNKKQKFAIKVIDLSKFVGNQIQLLDDQIQVMFSLNHPNIIKCIDVYKTDLNYFLVMEYCPHGDLAELVRLQHYITEDKVIPIMKQILDGYKFLMSKNIIHRDLKPANIMRFGNQWKIGDFGFAKYCKQQYLLEKLYVGTPFYMPPQSLQLNKYSTKSDIFALGVILFQMITGETPWPAKDQKQLLESMKQNKVAIPRILVSEQIKQFLNKALVLDYYSRMTKQQLKKFTLDNIDLQKLTKIKPRGISPGLKRQLNLTGKKSYMFSTRQNFSKNSLLVTTQKQQLQAQAKNQNKQNFYKLKFLMKQQFGYKNSPTGAKILKQNYQIMNNQLQFVKMINSLIHNCPIFGLNNQDYNYFCILLYKLSIKMLKMISNKRQNTYKFNKWDVFRDSDKFRTCITVMLSYINKLEAQYNNLIQTVREVQFKNFSTEFPQLVTIGAISFKVFGRVFQKLRVFINDKIIREDNSTVDQNIQNNLNLKCYSVQQLLEFMKIIKNRTSRQQQIRGFGLKAKPQLLSKHIFWPQQILYEKLIQLQNFCSQKIKIQHNTYFN